MIVAHYCLVGRAQYLISVISEAVDKPRVGRAHLTLWSCMPNRVSPPKMKQEDEQEAEHRTSVRAKVIHEAIRRDGDEELHRLASALGWPFNAYD
jgi:hypothetical protein